MKNLKKQQFGATLVVALVMLTVLTLLGVSTMKSSTVSLKMSANDREAFNNFQAASSAIDAALTDGSINSVDPDAQSKTYTYKIGENFSGSNVYSSVSVLMPAAILVTDPITGRSRMDREITSTSTSGKSKSTQIQGIRVEF